MKDTLRCFRSLQTSKRRKVAAGVGFLPNTHTERERERGSLGDTDRIFQSIASAHKCPHVEEEKKTEKKRSKSHTS